MRVKLPTLPALRRLRPARSPLRRTTDRVEDLVAWLLVALALLAGLGALAAGRAAHAAAPDHVRSGERSEVRAVLLAAVPTAAFVPGVGADARFVPVPARWTGADGGEQVGEVLVAAPLPAGAEVTAWVDRAGQGVPAPMPSSGAAVAGWFTGIGVLAGCWTALVAAWCAVRRWAARTNAAGWDRGWARVEPRWSGRGVSPSDG